MNIHRIYAVIFRIWRRKRMLRFKALISPNPSDRLLDVGGYPGTWTENPQDTQKIICLNIHDVIWNSSDYPEHRIDTIIGDGCDLKLEDKAFDIVFSNSVIEHVGDWQKQIDFAREVRRVGNKLWIQTPALECPLEPHFMAPFVHWLPIRIRRRILRWFTPWGWMEKPTQAEVDNTIAYTRLLSKKEFKNLFPDCVVITERLLWIIPKSYIAYRIS